MNAVMPRGSATLKIHCLGETAPYSKVRLSSAEHGDPNAGLASGGEAEERTP